MTRREFAALLKANRFKAVLHLARETCLKDSGDGDGTELVALHTGQMKPMHESSDQDLMDCFDTFHDGEDGGTTGQDRESHSDDQDRENCHVDKEAEA